MRTAFCCLRSCDGPRPAPTRTPGRATTDRNAGADASNSGAVAVRTQWTPSGADLGLPAALAVFVVVVLIVVIVVRRNADNQSISLPPGGLPVPTGPVVTLPGSGATSTIFSIVQQPWGPRDRLGQSRRSGSD